MPPRAPQSPEPQPLDSPEPHRPHWRAGLKITVALLAVWAVASLGLSIFWVEALNRFQLGGFPLGFWFAQQGAPLIFIVVLGLYAWLMDRVDRRHLNSDR